MREINYGSVCSGIEAATTAWHPLGWSPRWFAEIEPFPSAVLAHHWPQIPNLGDFTAIRDKIAAGAVEAPDVFCAAVTEVAATLRSGATSPASHGKLESPQRTAPTGHATRPSGTPWPSP